MIFPLVKFRLHAKDETHSSKFQQVMAIFVYQGEAKSQFLKILKSRNLAQFFRFRSKLHVTTKCP